MDDEIKAIIMILIIAIISVATVVYVVQRSEARMIEQKRILDELNSSPVEIPTRAFGQSNVHWYYYETPVPDPTLNVTVVTPTIIVTPRPMPAITPTGAV